MPANRKSEGANPYGGRRRSPSSSGGQLNIRGGTAGVRASYLAGKERQAFLFSDQELENLDRLFIDHLDAL